MRGAMIAFSFSPLLTRPSRGAQTPAGGGVSGVATR